MKGQFTDHSNSGQTTWTNCTNEVTITQKQKKKKLTIYGVYAASTEASTKLSTRSLSKFTIQRLEGSLTRKIKDKNRLILNLVKHLR